MFVGSGHRLKYYIIKGYTRVVSYFANKPHSYTHTTGHTEVTSPQLAGYLSHSLPRIGS